MLIFSNNFEKDNILGVDACVMVLLDMEITKREVTGNIHVRTS